MTTPSSAVTETDETAQETLRITRVESRVVLDHQIDLLNEIDERALRTVRTSIVVLALLASAGQIAGPAQIRSLHWIQTTGFALAGILFVLAILVGMAIYTVSHVPYGIGPTHRAEAEDGGYSERDWLKLLLEEYDDWSTEVLELTENNARWLTYAQGSFVGGTIVITVAIAASLPSIGRAGLFASGLVVAVLILLRRVRRGDHQ